MPEVKGKFAEISAFWTGYQATARARGIAANRVKWYEHRRRRYEKFLGGAPLAGTAAEQVGAFLANLEQNPALQPWQLAQASDALHITLSRPFAPRVGKGSQCRPGPANPSTGDHPFPISRNTQNQALNALVFFHREILGLSLGDYSDFLRARKPKHAPPCRQPRRDG